MSAVECEIEVAVDGVTLQHVVDAVQALRDAAVPAFDGCYSFAVHPRSPAARLVRRARYGGRKGRRAVLMLRRLGLRIDGVS